MTVLFEFFFPTFMDFCKLPQVFGCVLCPYPCSIPWPTWSTCFQMCFCRVFNNKKGVQMLSPNYRKKFHLYGCYICGTRVFFPYSWSSWGDFDGRKWRPDIPSPTYYFSYRQYWHHQLSTNQFWPTSISHVKVQGWNSRESWSFNHLTTTGLLKKESTRTWTWASPRLWSYNKYWNFNFTFIVIIRTILLKIYTYLLPLEKELESVPNIPSLILFHLINFHHHIKPSSHN